MDQKLIYCFGTITSKHFSCEGRMYIRNYDGAEIVESEVLDLVDVQEMGIVTELPEVLRRFKEGD